MATKLGCCGKMYETAVYLFLRLPCCLQGAFWAVEAARPLFCPSFPDSGKKVSRKATLISSDSLFGQHSVHLALHS